MVAMDAEEYRTDLTVFLHPSDPRALLTPFPDFYRQLLNAPEGGAIDRGSAANEGFCQFARPTLRHPGT
jgi:hypothetical protein